MQFLPQAMEPQPQKRDVLSDVLGSILVGSLTGGAKEFTAQRSRRKLGEILSNEKLSSSEQMNALLSTPGISQEDQKLYFEGLKAKKASEPKPLASDPIARANLNSNRKLVSGILHDSRKSESLLKEAEGVLNAIESGDVRGQGLKGMGTSTLRFLTGRGTTKDEQRLDTIRKRTLIEMGDLKGIRLTDTKLRMMQDALFAPGKSQEANLEAYRLFVNVLKERVAYAKKAKQILSENPNALYEPDFGIQLEETLEDIGPTENMSFDAQKTFDNLPDPSQYVGKKIRDDDTGEVYVSDGRSWKRVE